jgi:hypothetical protein
MLGAPQRWWNLVRLWSFSECSGRVITDGTMGAAMEPRRSSKNCCALATALATLSSHWAIVGSSGEGSSEPKDPVNGGLRFSVHQQGL